MLDLGRLRRRRRHGLDLRQLRRRRRRGLDLRRLRGRRRRGLDLRQLRRRRRHLLDLRRLRRRRRHRLDLRRLRRRRRHGLDLGRLRRRRRHLLDLRRLVWGPRRHGGRCRRRGVYGRSSVGRSGGSRRGIARCFGRRLHVERCLSLDRFEVHLEHGIAARRRRHDLRVADQQGDRSGVKGQHQDAGSRPPQPCRKQTMAVGIVEAHGDGEAELGVAAPVSSRPTSAIFR